jgi:hypothetical protein
VKFGIVGIRSVLTYTGSTRRELNLTEERHKNITLNSKRYSVRPGKTVRSKDNIEEKMIPIYFIALIRGAIIA